MFISPLVQRTLITLAVLTSFGVLVHDTKIDQATTLALALPVGLVVLAQVPTLRSEGHTHVERVAFEKSSHLTSGMPRVQPRDDHRKYVLGKRTSGFNSLNEHILMFDPSLA